MSLLNLLTTRIKETGPIPVAEYMSLCLGHPEFGYYMTRDPLGTKGDFTTAPEVSQIFGEVLGAALAAEWLALGSPDVALVECGPGRGTLMHDLLRATKGVSGFHDKLEVQLVEMSPVLRSIQIEKLSASHPRISWAEKITLPEKPILFVANEFFDALPVEQRVQDPGHTKKRAVDINISTGHLVFIPNVSAETIRETCPTALDILEQISAHITKFGGAAVIVDYGYLGGSAGDTLQAVKAHSYADPLADPGNADLTTHVNFSSLQTVAESHQLQTAFYTQGEFLRKNGAELRAAALCKNADAEEQKNILIALERLVSPAQMGELFKVLALSSIKKA